MKLIYNKQVEEGIISSMIIDNESIDYIISRINSSYLYDINLQLIFKLIVKAYIDLWKVDLLILKEYLEKYKKLDEVWWMTYLVEISEYWLSYNYKEYLEIVIEKYKQRKLQSLLLSIIEWIDQNDSTSIIEKLETSIQKLQKSDGDKDIKSISTVLDKSYEDICDMVENKEEYKKNQLKIWLHHIDRNIIIKPWNLMYILWVTWTWKTVTALTITKNVLEDNKSVLFFSLEMTEQELIHRMISQFTWINWFNIRSWNISEEELQKITETMWHLSEKKLFIDASIWLTINKLKSKIKILKLNNKIDLVIIDYLQLMSITDKWLSEYERLSQISKQLKELAKELDIPIICLIQSNRDIKNRSDKKPKTTDIRGSGQIEQDWDFILWLYREFAFDEFADKEKYEIWILKNRHWANWLFYPFKFNWAKQLIENI